MFKELEGIVTEDEALTPAEMLALDDYCYEHFIDLVPSLSTFGHMYTLLQSDKYKHLCELENFEPKRVYWMEKQWHHTIDPYNPESAEVVISMIEQYIPLFRSKYFNICCDETLDLCRGRNAEKRSFTTRRSLSPRFVRTARQQCSGETSAWLTRSL